MKAGLGKRGRMMMSADKWAEAQKKVENETGKQTMTIKAELLTAITVIQPGIFEIDGLRCVVCSWIGHIARRSHFRKLPHPHTPNWFFLATHLQVVRNVIRYIKKHCPICGGSGWKQPGLREIWLIVDKLGWGLVGRSAPAGDGFWFYARKKDSSLTTILTERVQDNDPEIAALKVLLSVLEAKR